MLSSVMGTSRSKHFACNFPHCASNLACTITMRQLRIYLKKQDWKLKYLFNLLNNINTSFFPALQLATSMCRLLDQEISLQKH